MTVRNVSKYNVVSRTEAECVAYGGLAGAAQAQHRGGGGGVERAADGGRECVPGAASRGAQAEDSTAAALVSKPRRDH